MTTGGSRFGSGAGPGRRAGPVSGFGLEGIYSLGFCLGFFFFFWGGGGGGLWVPLRVL